MTKKKALKQRIRQRMAKTGERYTAARAQILKASSEPKTLSNYPGLLPDYLTFGGIQGETAMLRNVLAHQQIHHPETNQPYSEAMLHGLCGGLGFMLAVFEYKGWPPMLTIVMRSGTMPQTYLMPVFERLGLNIHKSETSSAKVAEKQLKQALENNKPAICLIDASGLKYYAVPDMLAGTGPHYVAVAGLHKTQEEDEVLWLDDRSPEPCKVTAAEFAKARGVYRAGKRQLLTIESQIEDYDWRKGLLSAMSATVSAMQDGDVGVPKQFRSNCGFAGIRKWQGLLQKAGGKKNWNKVFNTPDRLFAGMRRIYECTQYAYTAPGASRPLYADFLREAGELLGADQLNKIADQFDTAGQYWNELTGLISNCGDAALEEACQLCDQRAEILDNEGSNATTAIKEIQDKLKDLRDQCQITDANRAKLFSDMKDCLDKILDCEEQAVADLSQICQ